MAQATPSAQQPRWIMPYRQWTLKESDAFCSQGYCIPIPGVDALPLAYPRLALGAPPSQTSQPYLPVIDPAYSFSYTNNLQPMQPFSGSGNEGIQWR